MIIVIFDYGLGNVSSIRNVLRKIGKNARISIRPDDMRGGSQVDLPGRAKTK